MRPILPDRIGPYAIRSLLGAGGMGEVFLADDPRLQRRVAIKRVRAGSVDPRAGRRLLTEARAAARLDHPNICAIHEVGEDDQGVFIVMPFVEGETLAASIARGPLPIADAVTLAAQAADALSVAHAHGILHRDVKPANIMIDTRRQARVMDFGLARIAAGGAPDAETATGLTAPGTTLGTVAYMSPEQVRGEDLDARSDLFALGIVLYEMVAGRRPFGGPSPADTSAAILTRDPSPLTRLRPDAPDELQRIVTKALQRRKEERYQTAGDFAVDLRALLKATPVSPPAPARTARPRFVLAAVAGIAVLLLGGWAAWRGWGASPSDAAAGPAAVPRIASIAVLPLANMSSDPSQDYVADGMTEALTTELARIRSLRVLSRTSTMQYKGTKERMPTMPEIARALNADALVEGSVLRDGDRLRITAQLIHGPSDRHMWADSYDGDLRDVLALQRRVAEAIAREVRATVTADDRERATSGRTVNPRAQDAYLRAGQLIYGGINAPARQRAEILLRAIDAYNEALVIQPDWAEAWAGIARARHWMVGSVPDSESQALYRASREAAVKAIGLDERVAVGHGALAYVSAANDWDFATAEREFKRAIELGPSGDYQHGYAMMLSVLGRHDEAKAMFEEAEGRDPLGFVLRINAAWDRWRARDFAAAADQARDIIARGNDVLDAHQILGWALSFDGRHDEAIAELASNAKRLSTSSARAAYAVVLARAGRRAEARAILREIESDTSPSAFRERAGVYACLGDRDHAMTELEHAYAARTTWLPAVNVEPLFDGLRQDPRFQALLGRLGIPRR